MSWLREKQFPRMTGWATLTGICLVVMWHLAPQQFPVVLYKLTLVCMAACMSYWIDSSLFKRVQDRLMPTMPRDILSAARVIVRGLIFLGVVLGLSLGV